MPKTLGAGKLRHVIKLQQKTATPNSYGEPTITWSDISSSVRANVLPVSGSETFNDPQMTSQEIKEFHIRYRSGLSPKDRILWKNITYNIEEIRNEDERNRKLVITATRVNT